MRSYEKKLIFARSKDVINLNYHIMTQTIRKFMNDNPVARWAVLIMVASAMFFAYMFVDVMSPLKSTLEKTVAEGGLGWSSTVFGTYA